MKVRLGSKLFHLGRRPIGNCLCKRRRPRWQLVRGFAEVVAVSGREQFRDVKKNARIKTSTSSSTSSMKRNKQKQKISKSIDQHYIFSELELETIENRINEIAQNKCRPLTIDHTPLRTKYFFGEGYTYGHGSEMLLPYSSVDSIPPWMIFLIIRPLENAGIIQKNFVNSVVVNDYKPGGCIVSHVDPPHIFDRPIVSLSLFSDSALCFGCKFMFKPIRCGVPLFVLGMRRGVVTVLRGFAANGVTHCVRPEDVTQRRVAIVLRRVLPTAPRIDAVSSICFKDKYEEEEGEVK